jgi:hypothetical protein
MISISYKCDLCGEECNSKIFKLPIAATFIGQEPCDLIPVEMNLCKKCRSEIYKVLMLRAPKERIKELNQLALDVKMGRHDE